MDLEHSLYDYVPKSSFSIAKDDIKPLLHAYAIGWGDHRELSTVKEKELYCVMLKVTEIIPTCQSILKVKQLNYDSIFCADKRCIGEFSKWVSSIFTNSLIINLSLYTLKKSHITSDILVK